jgi:Flp pilus assembly protein TadD
MKRTQANSVRFLVVASILFMPCAARVQAAPRLDPGLSQTYDAARAESAFRQVYEEGQQALRENRLADAEQAFQQILAMDPKNAGAYANLGVIGMRRKQWAAALRNLERSERLAPGVPGVRLNIGLTYYAEGQYKAAGTTSSARSAALRCRTPTQKSIKLMP